MPQHPPPHDAAAAADHSGATPATSDAASTVDAAQAIPPSVGMRHRAHADGRAPRRAGASPASPPHDVRLAEEEGGAYETAGSRGSVRVDDDEGAAAYPRFRGDLPWSRRSFSYQFTPFRGMWYDVRRRLPFLASDWTSALRPSNWWTVAQGVPRMYFINIMPALAYTLDMNKRTGGAYGVNEVLLASALAAIVFPVFAVQPLTYVGVTGLISLVNYTQYNIVVGRYGLSVMDYLRVQAWSLIWAAGFHFLIACFNVCDYARFITDMTSSTFGFYVGVVYIQKGVELLIDEFGPAPLDNATGWLSVVVAALFAVSVYLVSAVGRTSYLPLRARNFLASYAFAAGCLFWTGFSHFPDRSLRRVPLAKVPVTRSFFPTLDRPWFIDFWNIEARWAFVGAPLGFLITLLFYFDHNVSSIMAQARQFPVRRPAGFHWDFFLLGVTTLVSGFLGLPAPNGLVPQCPWHTESLAVLKQVPVGGGRDDETGAEEIDEEDKDGEDDDEEVRRQATRARPRRYKVVMARIVEQRLSHLVTGLLALGTMTRPLLVALSTMPRALFAGVFLLVGWMSIEGNAITRFTLAVFRDRRMAPADVDALSGLPRRKVALFVAVQWAFFAAMIGVSQTLAGIGFPVVIVALIPFRYYVVPRLFSPDELRALDAPTADAEVVLASIGHETEAVTGEGQAVARDTKIAGSEWGRGRNGTRRGGGGGGEGPDGKDAPGGRGGATKVRRRPSPASEKDAAVEATTREKPSGAVADATTPPGRREGVRVSDLLRRKESRRGVDGAEEEEHRDGRTREGEERAAAEETATAVATAASSEAPMTGQRGAAGEPDARHHRPAAASDAAEDGGARAERRTGLLRRLWRGTPAADDAPAAEREGSSRSGRVEGAAEGRAEGGEDGGAASSSSRGTTLDASRDAAAADADAAAMASVQRQAREAQPATSGESEPARREPVVASASSSAATATAGAAADDAATTAPASPRARGHVAHFNPPRGGAGGVRGQGVVADAVQWREA